MERTCPGAVPAALLLAGLLLLARPLTAAAAPASKQLPFLLVVGSLNVDIITEVERLPGRGETLLARSPVSSIAVGGKGANQAVAAARLAAGTGRAVRFVCRLGNDSYSAMLEATLVSNGVDVTGCSRVGLPSGQGLVLLEPDGTASSVVVGGANTAWPEEPLGHLVRGAGAVLLQREVPEHVNEAVAAAAAAAKIPVLLDVGGEDRPLSDRLLSLLGFVCPNESELGRLTGLPTGSDEEVLAAAKSLVKRGARSVLVTLAERGALLVSADGSVLRQAALPVPGGTVVDGTAAGDAFRAAFAVALVEGRPMQACLQLAAAAGALAVSRLGAVPSLPGRPEAELLAAGGKAAEPATSTAVAMDRGTCGRGETSGTCTAPPHAPEDAIPQLPGLECPYQFASRLNSMHARRDLAGRGDGEDDVLGWIQRQSHIRGLSLVDLNHPQHTAGLAPAKLLAALRKAGLAAGAVCIRFPEDEFAAGAFSNPDPEARRRAVALAVEGCRYAAELGARDLVVWSPFDGYDYAFQVDYPRAWRASVEAFRALADACPPGMRVSLEFKPTDPASRFSFVPSTGAALLLAREVDRPNFGLTLDVGHLLLAGENPAQSVALVGSAGKLFGMQLNDAHVRLGAEDGLAFGSVNSAAALELVRWLQRTRFDGHIYFDTFPLKENPVREAEYNIRRFRALWARAARLAAAGIDGFALTHNAMGALELLEAEEGAGGGVAAAGTAASAAAAA